MFLQRGVDGRGIYWNSEVGIAIAIENEMNLYISAPNSRIIASYYSMSSKFGLWYGTNSVYLLIKIVLCDVGTKGEHIIHLHSFLLLLGYFLSVGAFCGLCSCCLHICPFVFGSLIWCTFVMQCHLNENEVLQMCQLSSLKTWSGNKVSALCIYVVLNLSW